jgi:hypothetical protein
MLFPFGVQWVSQELFFIFCLRGGQLTALKPAPKTTLIVSVIATHIIPKQNDRTKT